MRFFKFAILSLSFATLSFASEVQLLEQKLHKLYKMHALQCAPEEIGAAEAYIETLEGALKAREEKNYELTPIDKLIFTNRAEIYLAKAERKVLSDEDNDGIPCYKEIEKGTNPYIPDNLQKKKEKTTTQVVKQNENKKKQKLNKIRPLEVQARVHFKFDSAQVEPEYLPYLNIVSHYLKEHKNLKVKIIGYTDNIGSKKYNDKLALKRAKAVRDYLVKFGISPKRIEIIGKGKEGYLFDNKTPLNRYTNRRADFFIVDTQ